MRKHITHEGARRPSPSGHDWLDLEHLAQVELTSEDPHHPIESALIADTGGWHAQEPGKQTVRLIFDNPQRISRIQLGFEEAERERTQEFVLRWSPGGGAAYREIVRQQYHFSPPDTARELEDYTVDLNGVTMLELNIIPDISGGDARASLARLRVAG